MKKTITITAAIMCAVLSAGAQRAVAAGQFSRQGAMAIMQTGDGYRLLAYGRAWLQAEPRNADAWFVIGSAYGSRAFHIGLGRPVEAAAAFAHVVQLQPQSTDGWVALGMTDEELNRWSEAAVAFQHCTQINPDNTHYWDQLAISYGHAAQYQLEVAAVANLERHARNVQDWNMAGTDLSAIAPFYDSATMLRYAENAYEKALEIAPRNGNIINNIGTVEQLQGHWQTALDDYRKAASLGDPLGRTNFEALQRELAQARAAASQAGQPWSVRCIPCMLHDARARAYFASHPTVTMSEALARTE